MPSRSTPAVLTVLCCPGLHPAARDVVAREIGAPNFSWGALLEHAIRNKMLCVLAAYLSEHRLQGVVPRPIMRHLHSTLRANEYKTTVFRAEVARVIAALDDADLAVAAVQGIAHESTLYGGRGARQFSDLDLLTTPQTIPKATAVLADLGYRPNRPRSGGATLLRTVGDPIVPCIPVELTTGDLDTGVADLDAMRRRVDQPIPGQHTPLPVLAADDAFRHALARLVARPRRRDHPGAQPTLLAHADALRLYATRAHPQLHPVGRARDDQTTGWTELRRILPRRDHAIPPVAGHEDGRP